MGKQGNFILEMFVESECSNLILKDSTARVLMLRLLCWQDSMNNAIDVVRETMRDSLSIYINVEIYFLYKFKSAS